MTLQITAVDGIGEVTAGTDIAALITEHADLRDGDVVVVTSKIVSKSLGLATTRDRDEVVDEGTDRVVARRGPLRIVRTHRGLVMAAAGVDGSNVDAGTVLPLPPDPDGEARRIRAGLEHPVGIIISDTAGRAWRVGQTDIAIGCAGVAPTESFAGRTDTHGNDLVVTEPAVADEIAGAAELASGKLGGRPVVVVRGLPAHLLLDDDGPGAAALVRDEDGDLFGLGARDAVLAAIAGQTRGFPAGEDDNDHLLGEPISHDGDRLVVRAADPVAAERLRIAAVAHRLDVDIVVEPRDA